MLRECSNLATTSGSERLVVMTTTVGRFLLLVTSLKVSDGKSSHVETMHISYITDQTQPFIPPERRAAQQPLDRSIKEWKNKRGPASLFDESAASLLNDVTLRVHLTQKGISPGLDACTCACSVASCFSRFLRASSSSSCCSSRLLFSSSS